MFGSIKIIGYMWQKDEKRERWLSTIFFLMYDKKETLRTNL